MCNLTGREPSAEIVERVTRRYEAIGGCSPLVRIAGELGDAVRAALARHGHDVVVEVGMRYWEPYVADAVDRLAAADCERIVVAALSPFESAVTHGQYRAAVDAALETHPGITASEAPLLSELPAFVALHARAARIASEALDDPGCPIVFSAHSLPRADVVADDPYVRGLERCADEVAAILGLEHGARRAGLFGADEAYGCASGRRPWVVAYQSRGLRGGEWLNPDVDDVIDAIEAAGHSGVVVVPLGFATDHLETLYDLDIVTAGRARAVGLAFERSAAPNADPQLAAELAAAIVAIIAADRT